MQLYDIAKKSTSEKVLSILSKDKNQHIRWRITVNENTPIDILVKLSKDKNYDVKYNARKALINRGIKIYDYQRI